MGGLALTALMVLLYAAQPPLLRQIDHTVYDMLLRARSQESVSPLPVIIDINDASLAAYGQWPWPRYLLAALLTRLKEQGVAAVGVDIMLTEADRSSPERMRDALRRDAGLDIGFTGLPEQMLDYDALFAETLSALPVVLGAYAVFDGSIAQNASMPPPVSFVARMRPGAVPFEQRMLNAKGGMFPLPAFWEHSGIGLINMSPDMDGIIRQVPLVMRLNDTVFPSLALRTLMAAMGQNVLIAQGGPDGLESLRIGPYQIPVTPQGTMLVPFHGPQKTYSYISAADVLQQKLPQGSLAGKIVFVGTSAPGLLDIRATPFDRHFPGVEVHAVVVDSIINGRFIRVPPWAPGAQVLVIIVCGLMATAAFGFARPAVYVCVGFGLLAASVYASRQLFDHGVFVSPLFAMLTIALQGSLLLFLRFWHEEQQKLVLRNAFSRYVSPEVVRRITKLRGNIFAGEERELSIMFTDIRRFTSISENLGPQQVVTLLNRYFTLMTSLVRDQGGTMDKFMGDALMAFWNAPIDVPGHPVRAVRTALAMQNRLAALNAELQQEFGLTLAMGVGVHTGKVYVGNMGSEELINYTLIGDAVNLTSRLEGLCSIYGVGVVVSEETARRCEDAFAFQFLDTLKVKGKQKPVTVYIPMHMHDWEKRRDEMQAWDKAQELYKAGNFTLAAEAFAALERSFPLTPPYALYASRARALSENPPAAWDGVWLLHSKKNDETA